MQKLMTALVFAMVVAVGRAGVLSESSTGMVLLDNTSDNGLQIETRCVVSYGSVVSGGCVISDSDEPLVETTNTGLLDWKPKTLGVHTLAWTSGDLAMTTRVNVVSIRTATPVITPADGTIIGETQQV